MKKLAWLRLLEVRLTSQTNGRQFVFGDKTYPNNNLHISVDCYKYMSMLKDNCTIKIDNLTYAEVISIIQNKYFDVEVLCGYKSVGLRTIFKGGVLWISNSLNADRTNTIIILCASNMVAKFGQSRLNLSLQSGINMYSAISFVSKRAGIRNPAISSQFKTKFLKDNLSMSNSCGAWIESLCNQNEFYISNSDETTLSEFCLFDASKSNKKTVVLTKEQINLVGGYPTMTNDGLSLTVSPSFNFSCGDVIKLDNSLIDISTESRDLSSFTAGYFLDTNGEYMIIEQHLSLDNRGASFSNSLLCKTRKFISNYLGVQS